MREIEIQAVQEVKPGATIKIGEDSRFQFLPDGRMVLFAEKYKSAPEVMKDGEEQEESDTEKEFRERWQLRPGMYWIHHSEGLKEKQYEPETYFETETSKRILKVFESFVTNVEVAKTYKRLKRSYLIHSAPGYGKSALIRHFCRKIVNTEGICILQTTGDIDFNILTNMFNGKYREDVKMIVLIIEDMGVKDHTRNLNIYNSSCLNFLDGSAGLFRVPTMIFATTNFAKELGAQFTNRPGRFNKIIKAALPSDDEVFALVERYTKTTLSQEERDALRGKNLTPDHCVEAILRSKIEEMTIPAAVAEILGEREGMTNWDS